MSPADEDPSRPRRDRNGKLHIPLPFEEALAAAVETKPPEPEPKKRPKKKPAR